MVLSIALIAEVLTAFVTLGFFFVVDFHLKFVHPVPR